MKWAGLGWGCGISLAAAVMTVDCTGFTEPLPCPGPALLHTTLQACVQRARPQQRTTQFYCDQTSLDKWWWHCAWHKSSHDWYRRTQYINHYKHVSILDMVTMKTSQNFRQFKYCKIFALQTQSSNSLLSPSIGCRWWVSPAWLVSV